MTRKKILLLSGSPRKRGNTAKILEKLQERLNGIAEVKLCHLPDYKVNGCLGCSVCQGILDKPGCVQRDDAHILLDKLIEADIILYGTPLYGHSYSGQLKVFMDRHVALFKFVAGADKVVDEMEIHSFIGGKPVGLLVSCQGPEEGNTELIKMQFDKFCESSLTVCFGKYIFPLCDPATTHSDYSEEIITRVVNDIRQQMQSRIQQLHLTLNEDSSAVHWANAQADKIDARGHVGTHLDCYTTIPKQSEYEINGSIIDCKISMPQLENIKHIGSLENMALVLHTGNLEENLYGTEEYFNKDTSLQEETLKTILSKKPLFIIIDSHGIAPKGIKHITFDKLCEAYGCHVIENVDLSSIRKLTSIRLKISINVNHPSTGKPCELYCL